MHEYHTEFTRLLSWVGKLSLEQQVGCFVSGLKDSIRIDVQASRPSFLAEAIGLARLYETKSGDNR